MIPRISNLSMPNKHLVSMQHAAQSCAQVPTLRVFSNWEQMRVIIPREAMNDSLFSTCRQKKHEVRSKVKRHYDKSLMTLNDMIFSSTILVLCSKHKKRYIEQQQQIDHYVTI